MSYYKNGYKGTVSTKIGKGEEEVVAVANVSSILPTGLIADEGLALMMEQYGPDRVLDFVLGQGWEATIKKHGHAVLKEIEKKDDLINVDEEIEKAATAMESFANSDMAPKVKVVKVKLSKEEVIAKLTADGININDPVVKNTIKSLLGG